MATNIETIKQLRSQSGAGVMECRKALEQNQQDFSGALAYLQEHAAMKAEKKSEREAREGMLELYTHNNGRIGVMVEIDCESEFASRSIVFRQFAHEIALQITSTEPLYVRDEEIPRQILDEMAGEAATAAQRAGKPARVVDKIVEGVLEKYKSQSVLLRQPYLRDETITIAQLLNQAIGKTGENIVIRRFVRWEISAGAQE